MSEWGDQDVEMGTCPEAGGGPKKSWTMQNQTVTKDLYHSHMYGA